MLGRCIVLGMGSRLRGYSLPAAPKRERSATALLGRRDPLCSEGLEKGAFIGFICVFPIHLTIS